MIFEIISEMLNSTGFQNKTNDSSGAHRRTDYEASSKPVDWPRTYASKADCHKASLKNTLNYPNESGVYILRMNGNLLKVGSAEDGVRKRMQQYYGLNKHCGLKEITEENRDKIYVTWQNCPRSKCIELESKLYKKYGQGTLAKRSPHSSSDTWDLLI